MKPKMLKTRLKALAVSTKSVKGRVVKNTVTNLVAKLKANVKHNI